MNEMNNGLESTVIQLASETLMRARHYANSPANDFAVEAHAAGVTPEDFRARIIRSAIARGEVLCELAHYDNDMSDHARHTLNEVEQDFAKVRVNQNTDLYCICHGYDVGDQRIFIRRESGNVDARGAALYLQFKAEEFFGDEVILSNLGIAALLIQHYGFKHGAATDNCNIIDMYSDRERVCDTAYYEALMENKDLHREGLKDFMTFHLIL